MKVDQAFISSVRVKLGWQVDRELVETIVAVVQAMREVEAEERDRAHDEAYAATFDHYGSGE